MQTARRKYQKSLHCAVITNFCVVFILKCVVIGHNFNKENVARYVGEI